MILGDKNMKDDCIFCKIINKEIPSYKIYENDYVYAFLDIAKDTYGHTLVIPKEHYENVFDCDDFYLAEVIKAVKKISNHYKEIGFKAVNILNASGKEAEQSVFHLHFHILPKMEENDFKAFPKFAGTDIELDKQMEKLKIE